MQAAHDATQVPLFVGQVFDRLVGATHTGLEKDEQPDAADQYDPEKKDGQRTQVVEGVQLRAESAIQQVRIGSSSVRPILCRVSSKLRALLAPPVTPDFEQQPGAHRQYDDRPDGNSYEQ